MQKRARAVNYWQSCCHHDDDEQRRLTRETPGRFILKIIVADRTERRPARAEAKAAALRNRRSLKAVVRLGECEAFARLAIAEIAAVLFVESDSWFHILVFPMRCALRTLWIQNHCWRTRLLQCPCHGS